MSNFGTFVFSLFVQQKYNIVVLFFCGLVKEAHTAFLKFPHKHKTHIFIYTKLKRLRHTQKTIGALCLQYYINAVDSWQAPTW